MYMPQCGQDLTDLLSNSMSTDTNPADKILNSASQFASHYLCPSDYSGTAPTHGRVDARRRNHMQTHQKITYPEQIYSLGLMPAVDSRNH